MGGFEAALASAGLTGAAAGAGVLTAVDEDDDGEEAPVPDAFQVDEDEAEEE